jgi:hypothetical protein
MSPWLKGSSSFLTDDAVGARAASGAALVE